MEVARATRDSVCTLPSRPRRRTRPRFVGPRWTVPTQRVFQHGGWIMQFDRDERYGRYERLGGPEEPGGGAYDRDYAARPRSRVYHGYGLGYDGGALRSRGSYQAGQLRSGLNPRDEFEVGWGEGHVGGRGYGGTNYDYEHGYRVGTRRIARPEPGAERE